MKKIVLALLLLMAATGLGAMTREQVCLEQNGFNQSHTDTNYSRGFLIWQPYGNQSDEWVAWQLTQDLTYPAYNILNCFYCKVKAGYYMALTSVNCTWDPAAYGADDATFSSNWGAQGGFNYNGFYGLYNVENTRVMTIKVPANITRLYALGYGKTDLTETCTVAVASGTATLVTSSLTFSDSGSFTAQGEDIYYPRYETSGYEAYPHYKSYCLIATDCGGASLTFTGSGTATALFGFIAINDNATAQPDTGVFDPTTIEWIMPGSFNNSGTQTRYDQYVEGPLCLNINDGELFFFGGQGTQHASASNKVTSPKVAVYADTTLKADYDISSNDAWTNPTDNAFVRVTADAITITLTGTMSLSDGTTTVADAGTYALIQQYTASGLAITQKFKFNAAAAAAAVKLEGSINGGYVAQWSLDNDFTQYFQIPYDTARNKLSAYDDVIILNNALTAIAMYDVKHDIVALFQCGFSYYDASATGAYSVPNLCIKPYSTGDGFAKIYLSPLKVGADVAVGENDEIIAYQIRTVTNINGLQANPVKINRQGRSAGVNYGK